jgi:acyl CoA:acetate/3-ketoacid CoA transferase beta subunit
MIECRAASRDEETFDQWVQEWILGIANHDEYVQKLGQDRIDHLHYVARHDTWTSELEAFADELSKPKPPTPVETMTVQASRTIAERIKDQGYTTILAGIGQAGLGAWLAAHALRDAGVDVALMAERGIYGHDPRPCDPFVFDFRNIPTATTTTDIFEVLGLYTCGAGNRCIGAIGAAQIDRFGNVNSTRTKEGRFVVGSGGANDIATAASETLVVVQQRRRAFVPHVDYITCPGTRIQCVISSMGRFEKRGGDELVLTGYFRGTGEDRDVAVREIQEHCGWELRVSDDLEVLDAPRDEELGLLRLFDPEGFFLGKPVPHTKATP